MGSHGMRFENRSISSRFYGGNRESVGYGKHRWFPGDVPFTMMWTASVNGPHVHVRVHFKTTGSRLAANVRGECTRGLQTFGSKVWKGRCHKTLLFKVASYCPFDAAKKKRNKKKVGRNGVELWKPVKEKGDRRTMFSSFPLPSWWLVLQSGRRA